MLYETDPKVNAPSTGNAQRDPSWIVFRAGRHSARLPFIESGKPSWDYVLDVTALGFRADREADAIVITGSPSDAIGGLLS